MKKKYPLKNMKTFYITFTAFILAFSMNAQFTGQIMDFHLEFIGYNADSQAEIALIATPDFTESNGNSSDIGCVIKISGAAAIQEGNAAFVNDQIGSFPNFTDEYQIPKSEWDIEDVTANSLPNIPAGDKIYQLIRTGGVTNIFFDAVAGQPIIMAVFKVYNGSALAPPTSGNITLLKNSSAIVAGNGSGYSAFLNINFPGLSGGTIDLYPGDPNPNDDGFTPAFSPISFGVLSTPEVALKGVAVYPNPTSGFVEIRGVNDLQSIEVFSIIGQQVMRIESSNERVDMSALQAGVYFMRITTAKGSVVKKIVKQN